MDVLLSVTLNERCLLNHGYRLRALIERLVGHAEVDGGLTMDMPVVAESQFEVETVYEVHQMIGTLVGFFVAHGWEVKVSEPESSRWYVRAVVPDGSDMGAVLG